MALELKRATRSANRIRMAIMGPTGSGKTYTALRIARGLVGPHGRICVIDTERGSASLYANEPECAGAFDTITLDSYAPETYTQALALAAREGYGADDVVIVDSLTHAWAGKDGVLEMKDAEEKRQRGGNGFTAWRTVTKAHDTMVDALVRVPFHLIVTMRVKMGYEVVENERGKKVPQKLGLQPVQRDGLEYEFDIVGDMDTEHNLIVGKTRISALADKVYPKPGAEVAQVLTDWLNSADSDAPQNVDTPTPEDIAKASRSRAIALLNDAINGKGLSSDKDKLRELSEGKPRADMSVAEIDAMTQRVLAYESGAADMSAMIQQDKREQLEAQTRLATLRASRPEFLGDAGLPKWLQYISTTLQRDVLDVESVAALGAADVVYVCEALERDAA